MPTVNLRPGDSGTVQVTFQGDTWQQFVTPRNAGTITLSPVDCSVYVQDPVSGDDLAKVVHGTTQSFPLVAQRDYLVKVAGTTDAQPNGHVDYGFV